MPNKIDRIDKAAFELILILKKYEMPPFDWVTNRAQEVLDELGKGEVLKSFEHYRQIRNRRLKKYGKDNRSKVNRKVR